MITARKRNCFVLIQYRSLTAGQWNDTEAWLEHAKVWVGIEPERGRESFNAGERESVVTHKIRGDYQELRSVDATMRIVFDPINMSYAYGGSPAAWTIDANARVFQILAVMPDFEDRGDIMISAAEEGRRYGAVA